MTVIVMPYPAKITRDSTLEVEYKEIRSQFGDGYSQASPDGLNAVREMWDITWAPLTKVERDTILAALNSVGTWGTITWTPCEETVEKKFQISGKVKYGRVNNKLYKVSCNLVEDFRV